MKKSSKKRSVRKVYKARKVAAPPENYMVAVRSWMVVVVFALMLGVGAILGTYLNSYLQGDTPSVAGVQTEVK